MVGRLVCIKTEKLRGEIIELGIVFVRLERGKLP